MNFKALLHVFLILCTGCNSQTKTSVLKTGKDMRIFLSGSIRDIQSKESIPFATYIILPSDTLKGWNGSVRRGMTDQAGNFKVDITTLVDSTKVLVIRCKYINYAASHVIIKGKVKKSLSVDVETMIGSGDYYTYYNVNPKKSVLILEKHVNKVSTPGY
jgi:hypothetical protein